MTTEELHNLYRRQMEEEISPKKRFLMGLIDIYTNSFGIIITAICTIPLIILTGVVIRVLCRIFMFGFNLF